MQEFASDGPTSSESQRASACEQEKARCAAQARLVKIVMGVIAATWAYAAQPSALARADVTYHARSGENVWLIAATHHIPVWRLLAQDEAQSRKSALASTQSARDAPGSGPSAIGAGR